MWTVVCQQGVWKWQQVWSLPPTDDSVELHILRSLLVLIHWNSSERNLPCPTDFGYKLLKSKLVPLMMRKPAKPKNVKLVSCKCKKSRCARGCPCQRAGFTSIAACLCLGSRQRCARIEEVSSDDEEETLECIATKINCQCCRVCN